MAENALAAAPNGWAMRQTIFEGTHLRLEYCGPAQPGSVLVAFPPFDYPFQSVEGGWGSRSFTKRGMAHVSVFHRNEDWHQHDEFIPAMQACRRFFGPRPVLTSYGFSMGGYAALLGAQALDAATAIAISPQFSIDPAAVRFERRYEPQWARMSGWHHDLAAHMDDARRYVVVFDPLHRKDARHERLLPKPAGYGRVFVHGAGHAGIQALGEMGEAETLFDLLRGDVGAQALRGAFRAGRSRGFRYLRKMGTVLHERGHPRARHFFDLAQAAGFRRLTKKWQPFYK